MTTFGKKPSNRVSVLDHDQVTEPSSRQYRNNYGGPIVERGDDLGLTLPEIHNTHLEQFWPRYLGLAAMLFAAGYYVNEGKSDPLFIALPSILFGLFTFWVARGLRNSLNALHTVRKPGKRSKAFMAGMGVGLAYWGYSTFVSPTTILGQEFGAQTVFDDGIQRQDMAAVASLLLQASVYAVVCGALFEFVNRRIIGSAK